MTSYNHVAELARSSSLATVDLSIEDYSCSNSLSYQDQDEVSRVAHLGTSKPQFRKSDGVRVVVDHNRKSNC
jgi:hypothetical protein